MMTWTTPAAIETKVRRRWATGSLLRSHALDEPFEPINVPLRGPSAVDLAENLDEARAWASAIEREADGGRRFTVVTKTIGGRGLGRSVIPGRAIVGSYEQAWRILDAEKRVKTFDRVLKAATLPEARAWVLSHPVRAIEMAAEWPAILAARDWLEWNRDSGLYLRQIDAPGVDTKLIERHRGVLAEILGVSATASGFAAELGFATKPARVRMRFDPALFGMPAQISEADLRVDEITNMDVSPAHALIIENEITYLSVPVPPGCVVIFGKGYDASVPAALSWLANTDVGYWGDIDTHGFRILDRVRSHLPHVRSVLMDRETLLHHEDRWGAEEAATNAHLSRLTPLEARLYEDLVSDRFSARLRLEQERLEWPWVRRALASNNR